jgi:hypothetical protein
MRTYEIVVEGYAVLERVRGLGLTVLEVRRLDVPPAVHEWGY